MRREVASDRCPGAEGEHVKSGFSLIGVVSEIRLIAAVTEKIGVRNSLANRSQLFGERDVTTLE